MMEQIKKFLKKVEPFIAICIFVFLLTLVVLLFQENQLGKEISENCGFGGEDYYCYCKQGDVYQIETILNGSADDPEFWENVKLVK